MGGDKNERSFFDPKQAHAASRIVPLQWQLLLSKKSRDIIYKLYLNFADAVLGCSVEVPVIDGKLRIKVPAGTSAGEKLKLKG